MPKRTDIKKVLVIGSGPIVIGQAAEFDYAGTQACLALREEGYDSGSWILIDFNSVIVHVFQPSAREFYSLERLWADATPIDTEFLTEE